MSDVSGSSGGLLDFHWDPLPSIMAAEWEVLGNEVTNYSKPLKDSISDVMVPSIKKNFAYQGRPDPWTPLAMSTLQRKAKLNVDNGTLIATEKLSRRAGAADLWNVDANEGTASIDGLPEDIAYGMVHQTGSARIPARPWALFQPEDEDAIETIFDDWIGERIARALISGVASGL
jgi:phage gpG-like protein